MKLVLRQSSSHCSSSEKPYKLRQYGAHDVDCRTTAQYETELHRVMLDTSKYKAGNMQRHLAAWKIWLQQETDRARAKEAKRVIEEGVRSGFVHPKSQPQQQHPKHEQKLQQVERLLSKLMGPGEARRLLDRQTPRAIKFPNKDSVDEHHDFLLEEERKLRETHSIFTWQELGMSCPLTLIHGLGVVVNTKGKKRLIVDARYLNLFLRYLEV